MTNHQTGIGNVYVSIEKLSSFETEVKGNINSGENARNLEKFKNTLSKEKRSNELSCRKFERFKHRIIKKITKH